jgi:hypothetical protein
VAIDSEPCLGHGPRLDQLPEAGGLVGGERGELLIGHVACGHLKGDDAHVGQTLARRDPASTSPSGVLVTTAAC